jgi:hypothetical protein
MKCEVVFIPVRETATPILSSVLNITTVCCKCEKCTASINLEVKDRKSSSRKLKGLYKN